MTGPGPMAVQVNGVDSQANSTIPSLLPPTSIPLPELCARIHRRIGEFLAEEPETERLRSVQEQTRISLAVIDESLRRYKLEELSLSYNGGKDCLVLLILYLCCLHKHPSLQTVPLQTVYIVSRHPFREVEEFVASSSQTCSLSVWRLAKPMKVAFTEYLAQFPKVKAIFVGTRRTDPHGEHLTHFDPTDHGWPDFMRIHPVIDWHYVEIWAFIRHLNISYCPLYDQGYTSLGGTTDTHPNPALRRQSISAAGEPEVVFRPAYELVEDVEERLGRELRSSQRPSQQPSKQASFEQLRPSSPRGEKNHSATPAADDNDTAII